MPLGKRLERILLEKVEDAHPVQLGYQARVITEIEILVEMYAFAVPDQLLSYDSLDWPT